MADIYTRKGYEQDKYGWEQEKKEAQEIQEQAGDSKLHNPVYSRVMTDWLRCTQMYTGQFVYAAVLDQQLQRSDLDTVCAYELFQMKKLLASKDSTALDYASFIKQD